MKCLCKETDTVLSSNLQIEDEKSIFVDVRFDAENNDLDFEYGIIKEGENVPEIADWSNSLRINYCPICGLPLIGATLTWYTPHLDKNDEAKYLNQKCTVIESNQIYTIIEFDDRYRMQVPRIELF